MLFRSAGVFGRGHYVGGSTVGMVMRDLALKLIKGAPFALDAKVYFSNEYVYAKDVALAIDLACAAKAPKQRIYNAGSGVVTKADDLAQAAREIVPKIEVTVTGTAAESHAEFPLDLSASKAELGYTPQFPLKDALRDYMEDLWSEGIRG